MDTLTLAASEYEKLLNTDYIYVLENGDIIRLSFKREHFHHLTGLQKLKDIPPVTKNSRNNPLYIYKNILNGRITLANIKTSRYFDEIEPRLRHFAQISRILDFANVIVDFDPLLISSKIIRANYILYKKSNDNMYLNLFLKIDEKNKARHIPLTFITNRSEFYFMGQKVLKIVSFEKHPSVIPRKTLIKPRF